MHCPAHVFIPIQLRGSVPGLDSRHRQAGACVLGALGTRAHKSRVAAELHSVVKPQPGQKSKKTRGAEGKETKEVSERA